MILRTFEILKSNVVCTKSCAVELLNMFKHNWRWTLNNILGSMIWSCETVCVFDFNIVCFPKKQKSPRRLERIENTSCPVEVVCFEEAKSSIGTCNEPPFVSEGFPGIPGGSCVYINYSESTAGWTQKEQYAKTSCFVCGCWNLSELYLQCLFMYQVIQSDLFIP